MAAPTKTNLRRAVKRLDKEAIRPRLREIAIPFWLQVAYHVSLIALVVIANLNPSVTTIVGSLGLGVLGVGGNFKAAQKAVEKFLRNEDRRKLKLIVPELNVRLDRVGSDDATGLAAIDQLLEKALEELKTDR